jgi:pyridoxine 4-oxidase
MVSKTAVTETSSWHHDTFRPDIVIVGAGSAGSLLGARLSAAQGLKVLLIEAGDEPNDPDIWSPAAWPALQGRSYDRNWRTVPQPGTTNRVHR